MKDFQIRLANKIDDKMLDLLNQAHNLAFDQGSLLTEPLRILVQRRIKYLEKKTWSEEHSQYLG